MSVIITWPEGPIIIKNRLRIPFFLNEHIISSIGQVDIWALTLDLSFMAAIIGVEFHLRALKERRRVR